MASSAILSIKILADASKAQKAMDQTSTKAGSFSKGLSKASAIAGGALLAVGAGALFAGKAAADDAKSQALLATAMKNSTGATDAQVAATEDYIDKAARATGVADDQLRPAMATLVRATGDAEKSQKALTQSLDISAATGKDVESVSSAIAKGYAGNTSALGRLVPGIDKAVLATGDMDAIMAELARTTGGSAAAAADTAAGKMARMKVSTDEAVESIGGAMLPVMDLAATALAKVADFAGKNAKAVQIVAGVVLVFAAAIWVLNAALNAYRTILAVIKVVQTATWLSALGPILLVVAAVALVVGAVVLLWKKSQTFRSIVLAVWGAIKTAVRVAAQVFRSVWQAAFAVVRGYIAAWRAYFNLIFGVIKALVKAVIAVFKGDWRGAFAAVRTIVNAFKTFFRDIFNALPDPVQKVIDKIKNGLGGAVNWLKTKLDNVSDALSAPWEAMKSAIDKVASAVESLIGWIGRIKIPDLGGLGGLISKVTRTAPAPETAGVRSLSAARVGSSTTTGTGPTIVVNGALDPEAVARQINRILERHNSRVGLAVAQ
jgi:hypothetical protein